ncbi:acid-sensing ion channel 1-like [Watersipora subatra]|uniref:acid-sensing ion channel 1-like n=1 Tax=Watersipora subatra TaxID=2589382 RepID=UPI00355C1B93
MASGTCNCKCECKQKRPQENGGSEEISWQSFTQEVSMHGIRYVSQKTASASNRVTWLFAIVVMLAYATGASYDLFSALIRKETTTKLKNTRVEMLRFPSVVFCDHRGYEKKAVLAAIEQYNLTGLDQFLLERYSYYVPASIDWSSAEFQNLANLSSAEWKKLLFSLVPPLESSIITASFGSQSLNVSAEFQTIFTDYGPCFIFNKDGKHSSTFNGIYSGLNIALSANVDEYWTGPLVSNNGFTIALLEPGDVPLMEVHGTIGITPGTSADILITQRKYFRQPPPADNNTANCYDTDNNPNPLTIYPTYTYNGCIRECGAKYINYKCGCRPMESVAVPGIEICSPKVAIECTKVVDWSEYMTFAVREKCNCLIPCKEVHYDSQSAIFQAPNERIANVTFGNGALNWQRKNLITMRLSYKTLSYETLEEHKPYGFVAVVANIGGTMGVCIGASALTVCEFIQFGIQAIKRRYNKWRKQNSTSIIHVLPPPKD